MGAPLPQAAMSVGTFAADMETLASRLAGGADAERLTQVVRLAQVGLQEVAALHHVEAPIEVLDALAAVRRAGRLADVGRLGDRLWGWAERLAESAD